MIKFLILIDFQPDLINQICLSILQQYLENKYYHLIGLHGF